MIQYRTDINESEKYNNFFRKIEGQKNIKNNSKINDKNNLYCIDEQRNNLFSTIEYLNLVNEKYDLKDIICVFINELENVNLQIIYDMFKKLEYIIFDPSKYLGKQNIFEKDNIKILLENYNDESYLKIKELNKKNKKIIIFSNLKYNNNEKDIITNLKKQELWCKQLDVISFFIKFKIINELAHSLENINLENFTYLKGDIYIPLYSNINNEEFNLINIGELKYENYNLLKIKDELRYYHNFERVNIFEYKNSKILKDNLLGYDDGYESVGEYYILYEYFKNKNNKNNIDINVGPIIELLYKINLYYLNILQNSLVTCLIKSILFDSENKNNKKEDIQKIEKIFINFIQIIYSIKYQIIYLRKGTLLNKNEYNQQIELVNDIIDKLNKYMKDILDNNNFKKSKNYYYIKKIVYEYEYYLKYFINQDLLEISKEQENELKNNMNMIKKVKNYIKQMNGDLKKKDILIIQIPILNLFKELDELKMNNPMSTMIIDKKDYFYL